MCRIIQFRLTFLHELFQTFNLSFICHYYETFEGTCLIQTVYVLNRKFFIAKLFTSKLEERLF